MVGANGWLVTWHPQSGSKQTNAQLALFHLAGPRAPETGMLIQAWLDPVKLTRALNPHMLSIARHKEKSVRALVCFTGERLEV